MPITHLVRKIHSPRQWRGLPKSPRGTKRRRLNRFLSWLIVFGAAGFALGALGLAVAFAWFSRDLPNPDKINDRQIAQSTKIFDRTGKQVLYEIHGEEKRTVIHLEDITETAKQATLVAEDRDFYRHRGFDLRGILRALVKNIIRLNPSGQGGSTITQQFIKNSILTSEKTYTRKIKELVLAYQLERRFSKDAILKLYFNEIPYGSNAYGIEAAAQSFFGKPARELTLAESALLAALPRAPTFYSPYGNNREALIARQHTILDGMVDEKYITKEQAEEAKKQELKFLPRREGIVAPHFVFYVRELLTEKFGETAVEQGGLRVITTLDVKHQQAAEDAITEFAQKNEEQYGATNSALVSVDTKTGQILAMVGSRDYFDLENDGNVNVALRPRQPGSSFKPIVYATAFDRGYTPETMVFDLVTNFDTGGEKPYIPKNYDGREHGPIPLRKALAGSLNIPAVQVLYLAGVERVLDTAERFGYTTFKDRSRFGLSLVLGGAEVKLLEHVGAFATLAREGIRHPTTPFLRIEDKNWKNLEEFRDQEVRVMDEKVVRKVNSILSDNEARSFIFGSRSPLILPDRPVAAKTGTTDDYRDGWTLGFTPTVAAGVWSGRNDNTPMKSGADGVLVAAPIWQSYMKRVLTGTLVETFKAPEKDLPEKPILSGHIDVVHEFAVDRLAGDRIPESCLETYPKAFVEKRKFKETHSILHWVKKDDPRGPVPDNPSSDPQYAAWESSVRSWAEKNGYPDLQKINYVSCDLRSSVTAPLVHILSPAAGSSQTAAATNLLAEVESAEDITNVSFAIDGTTVGTAATPPYSIGYINALFENGEHELIVTATDALGTQGEGRLRFTYTLGSEASSLSILSPQDSATFKVSDFPLEVGVSAFDPSGIEKLELNVDGKTMETENAPKNGVTGFILQKLDEGVQTLTVTMLGRSGFSRSATVTIKIQSS